MEQTHRNALCIARILCDDDRQRRFYENEASLMGFHLHFRLDGRSEDAADLVIWDADRTPTPDWGALSDTASLIVITRDAIPDNVTLPDFRRTDLLRRPFDISALEDLLSLYAEAFLRTHEPPPPAPPATPTGIIPSDDFSSVSIGDDTVSLTPQEGRILSCLWESRGKTVSREELQGLVGGSADSNSIEVYVCHLRRKLETPSSPRLIRTVRGKGYIIE